MKEFLLYEQQLITRILALSIKCGHFVLSLELRVKSIELPSCFFSYCSINQKPFYKTGMEPIPFFVKKNYGINSFNNQQY
jgi:hypothetical protein